MTIQSAVALPAECGAHKQLAPKSYAPEVIADSSGKWCGNGLRFATFGEADANVKDLYSRWSLVIDTRVVPSMDAPNYRWQEGKLVSLS